VGHDAEPVSSLKLTVLSRTTEYSRLLLLSKYTLMDQAMDNSDLHLRVRGLYFHPEELLIRFFVDA
jgi:hypothetical protein